MKITMTLAGNGDTEEKEAFSRWVGLVNDDGNERLQGEDGRIYARRSPKGVWFAPDGRVVVSLNIFDDKE